MARILDLFLNRNSNKACHRYPDARALLAALAREEGEAVRCLSSKISGSVFQIGKSFRLVDDDIEELHCDCIMIFIDKIRTGKYEYTGNEPATYVIEVAKRRVYHYARKAGQSATNDLDPNFDRADEPEWDALEQVELLEKLLTRLNDNCQKLIRLKYLEEQKDKDVIEQKLTQYSTVDALKNHRAQCMKKLTELAAQSRLPA